MTRTCSIHSSQSLTIKSISMALSLAAANCLPVEATAMDKQTGGMGLGLILGAVVAGPPGAIAGAIGGRWAGYHDTQQELKIVRVSSELAEKENQLTKIQTELSATEVELNNAEQRIRTKQRLTELDYLNKGLSTTIYFRTGESDLHEISTRRLTQFAQALKELPGLLIIMEGHADVRGNNDFNQKLSEQRVDTVQQLLLDAGIPKEKIQCHAHGETRAMTRFGDQDNYVFDRRVSIHLSMDPAS